MEHYIDGINFHELENMKYYAPPASWSKAKIHDTSVNRIFSGDWWGAQKRDGAFYKFIKDEDGNCSIGLYEMFAGGSWLVDNKRNVRYWAEPCSYELPEELRQKGA